MGNCVFKGFGGMMEVEEMVKVVTTDGGIMELYAPITAECVTNEFPGHAIYRSRDDLLSPPLLHNEELHAGHLYYLLPFNTSNNNNNKENNNRHPHKSSMAYRMSFDNERAVKRSKEAEVITKYNNTSSGVWKVKLVISPEQLAEILAQEARTEELIESVRTVAKCGNAVVSSTSVANSDQWSVSSSTRKGVASADN